MNPPLHLLRLDIDARALIRFAQAQGINQAHDEDLGYATHAWLAAYFGELAPKPYRILAPTGTRLTLLAYSEPDSAVLAEHAAASALPEAHGVLDPLALAHSRLPAQWRDGVRLGFEVLACPVTRQGQAEKDVFLRRLAQPTAEQPHPERGAVYREWLAAQFGEIASLDGFRLDGFRLVRVMRRTQATSVQPSRTAHLITRPQALCRGTLSIRAGERMGELLRRGIGRHRAFGYGMLLLRPAP